MKKTKLITLTLVSLLLLACAGVTRVVPVTGRKQKVSADNATLLSLSLNEYKKYVSSSKLSTNAANTAMVRRVGQKLATAVETYLKNNGYASEVSNYNWEFNLVQDKQMNAFCMPGGKIVVYEGLLPVTKTEAALAVVLGHEIAHAVAYHSSEQMTKQQNQQMLGGIVNTAITAVTGQNTATSSVLSQLYGLGSNMATLKYSRDNETEADHIGLIFAAMAGYDPNEAISFWQRMASSSGGSSTPQWLSTHPSDAQRVANLKRILPDALKYYRK
jgi:predicted Zn-dependent protease